MAETIEARWLREHWSEEYLSEYAEEWIAIVNEQIVAHGRELRQVIERTEYESSFVIEGGARAPVLERPPLYAFVFLERLQ